MPSPPIPPNDPTSARFQAALLQALHEHDRAEDVLAALEKHPEAASYRDYLALMEPRMVEVAAELVKKWGRQGPAQELQ